MPGKPRQGKGKSTRRSRKGQPRHNLAAPSPQAAAVTAPAAAAAPPPPRAPSSGMASKTPSQGMASRAQYPYFTAELRRIAIMTGIIVVVLIVLSRLLG